MSLPKYQIFVSSTFRDLIEERDAVLNAILKLNQFPAGMELFPATDDTAWKHIERVIRESDYYVLLIGGKYGSVDDSGISYTEKEYDFAIAENVPVLAFVRSDPESIPLGKSELDPELRHKLNSFKEKVGKEHHLNYWKTIDELRANVLSSLSMAFAINPQKGWIRAGGIEKSELLERLADLQNRYDDLSAENNRLKSEALSLSKDIFAQGSDPVSINFSFGTLKSAATLTYDELFFGIGEKLFAPAEIGDVKNRLEKVVFDKFKSTSEFKEFVEAEKLGENQSSSSHTLIINELALTEIEIQFQALELISVSGFAKQYFSRGIEDVLSGGQGSAKTKMAKTWTLTDQGRRYFLAQRAARRIREANENSPESS